jgi:hypothetical protein
MAPLAIRVTLLNYECVGLFLFWLIRTASFCSWGGGLGRVQKRITAFRAKEMELVVVPLAKHRIVQSDEARLDDWGLAMMTAMGEFLAAIQI